MDFFQFVCGGFYKSANEDDNPLTDAAQEMTKRLVRLITTKNPREGDFDVDQKVRNFYRACKKFKTTLGNHQQETKDQLLAQEITRTLQNVGLEGWPFSNETFGQRTFAWHTIVPKMIEEAVVFTDGRVELPIVNVEVGVSDLTKDEYVLKINSPDFDM